nr:signal peptidase I [uncultured Marvinbryantia sp.]
MTTERRERARETQEQNTYREQPVQKQADYRNPPAPGREPYRERPVRERDEYGERPAQERRGRRSGARAAREEKQRRQEEIRKGYVSLLIRIVLLAAAGWLLLTQVFLITQVSGNGMFPALKDGDLVFAFRLQQEYAKKDVVVYEVDGQEYIGRIAARGTDVVTLDDSGTLLVNGTVQSGEILYPTYAEGELEYPYVVPEGCVFVLGDYRTQTVDSRTLGAVPMGDVRGKVITILRRRGL